MRILMLNYEYPLLGGGGSNACKYILKEFAKKNFEVDLVTSSPVNTFETEKIGSNISIYKLPINIKDIHYWTQREIIKYSLKAHGFIKNLMKEKGYEVSFSAFSAVRSPICSGKKCRILFPIVVENDEIYKELDSKSFPNQKTCVINKRLSVLECLRSVSIKLY